MKTPTISSSRQSAILPPGRLITILRYFSPFSGETPDFSDVHGLCSEFFLYSFLIVELLRL